MLTISKSKKKKDPFDGAEVDCLCGELDHYEPADGQREGEPDGDGVDHDAEVSVEQQKGCPSERKLKFKTFDLTFSKQCCILSLPCPFPAYLSGTC